MDFSLCLWPPLTIFFQTLRVIYLTWCFLPRQNKVCVYRISVFGVRILWKPYMLSWRTKDWKFECLKKDGRTDYEKALISCTMNPFPYGFQLIIGLYLSLWVRGFQYLKDFISFHEETADTRFVLLALGHFFMCFEYLKLLAKELLWRQLIKYIMRRASKVRQFQLGYSDDQLENIIIRLNNEAMGELQAGNLKKVQQILTQANLMLERFDKPDKISATKQRLKAFTLNGWACYQHQKKQSADALKLIDEAIKLQQGAMQDNLSLARSYLNKCVILSQMENHEEALKLAHLAITCLENEKKGVGASRKRRQKLSQLFVISFYNIAAEFEFLDNDESATDAYKKGYEICRELLGERHRLSLLMRKNLKIMKSRRDSRIPTLSDMDVSSRKRRIKTIEIQLYRDRRNSSKKYSKDNRSTLFHLERGKSRENPISESRLLSKPENYLHLKNIKERISRLGNQNNQEEDETKVVTRLRKIYMPDSYRKHKVKSRKTSKTQNSTNSGKHNHTQQIESINNHWSRRQDKFMVHSQVYHTAPSIKQSYLTQKILPPVTQPPPSQLPQKSIQLPNINRPNLTQQKSRECKLI